MHFAPSNLCRSEGLVIETIEDLTLYVRTRPERCAPLRDESTIAAAMTSPARLQALRAPAISSFQAAAIDAA